MLQLVFWLPAFERNAAGEVKNACSHAKEEGMTEVRLKSDQSEGVNMQYAFLLTCGVLPGLRSRHYG